MQNNTQKKTSYGHAIREGFEYLLEKHPEVFIIGQGLWSPWYVGNSMTELDKQFGKDRVIDTPVSEAACTGAGVGAALSGMRPIVVHPRIDFMLYAIDPIVNQAAKWSHMTGGQANAPVTIRGIINRGGEQGAQHSQSLHSWFAHIPGLRVVMPSTPKDARDLLIASVLCDDPVIYIDDRWLYELEDNLEEIVEIDLKEIKPSISIKGDDLTIVSSGFSSQIAREVSSRLSIEGISSEVIDCRVLNPLDPEIIISSVEKTRRLVAVDGGWSNCGFASEIITSVVESINPQILDKKPMRITLPSAPAPTARNLEKIYYPDSDSVFTDIISFLNN